MNWFENQTDARHRMDVEELEKAYARLAASVSSDVIGPHITLSNADAADSAIDAVLGYYGADTVPVPDDITDPMERVDFAIRPTGVMRRPVRLVGSWWKDAAGAYLATTRDGTPVAVLPRKRIGYGYVDPATHIVVHVNKRTAELLQEEALCFYRPLPQRELTVADMLPFMLRSLDLKDYALILGSMFVSTYIGLLPAMLSKLLFSRIIPSGIPSLIVPVAALLIGMTIAQALIQLTSSVILARINTKLQVQVEAATYARVLMLPPSFFKDYAAGDLANRAMAMTQLITVMSQFVVMTLLGSLFSVAYLLQLFAFAPQLAVPAIAVVLVQVAATVLYTMRSTRYNSVQMQKQAKLSGLTPALLHGMQKIKLAGAEARAFSHWAHRYADVAEATYRRPALLLSAPNLVPLIGAIGTVIIYYLAASSRVSIPDYMAFNTAFGSVSASITALAGVANVMAVAQPLLELVEPILKTPPEALSNQRQITSVNGAIEVNRLSFRYADNTPLIFDDLSLRIRPGEYVAIVGRTGCGKSTLMRLLLGFEKPTKGAIFYNGQDISTIDIRSLRRNIGVVMQGASLFSGDLYTNIVVSTPRATLEDAWEAAELADVANDIGKMPMGMHTLLSEGNGGLSGGQRQRILIARAVCGKPKIIMLDEATSALDNITQKHVSDALASLKCTRVVIAHRLSTIRQADRIIMLEGGKIVEDGTYDELVAQGGMFADLVARQHLEEE